MGSRDAQPPALGRAERLKAATEGRLPNQAWRSLEELTGAAAEWDAAGRDELPLSADAGLLDRRGFLKLAAGGLAVAGLGACGRPPDQEILPYVRAPEFMVPGQPVFYATALPLDGYARGVLVETNMGRPVKVEGNPEHPASLGATDIFAQAAILDLWDPDRSQALLHHGEPTSAGAFARTLAEIRSGLSGSEGRGLHILTSRVTSPSLIAQLQTLRERYPQLRWYHYQPLPYDNLIEGAQRAFGERLLPRLNLQRARPILALDADFLGPGPMQVRYARDLASTRNTQAPAWSRLYVAEPSPTLTGATADHRLALPFAAVEDLARTVAQRLGLGVRAPAADLPREWVDALVEDLRRHGREALVVAGPQQPPAVQLLACAINARLGAIGHTVSYGEPADAGAEPSEDLPTLVQALEAGAVDTLLILDANPVYEAPVDLRFGQALEAAGQVIHLGLYRDETAWRSDWHIPAAHPLESWGDLRAFDGTATILQPTIAPLYEGRTAQELVAALLDGDPQPAYELVRSYWREHLGDDFETRWREALRQGLVAGSALPDREVTLRADWRDGLPAPAPSPEPGLEVVFSADPSVYDGRFANNAWLQELPKPITKLTWGNAALIAPSTAARLELRNGEVVRITKDDRAVEAPVWVVPGQAADCITLPLGYGREHAGRIASGLGFDANALRTHENLWHIAGVALLPTGAGIPLATTQHHHTMAGRDLVRLASVEAYRDRPESIVEEQTHPGLYPPWPSQGHAWAMSIDLNACIGCNACTIACQVENNIPVVGKQQVIRGREMHWIRVDRYFSGTPDAPQILFQPVPCMHCGHAPCEVVCPVEATIHDSEGLNLQVYNRCVGTRFCSNNCPYKVRRFNFLRYAERDVPELAALRNPQVTVRQRGVMEKCTYCLQRINAARRAAQTSGQPLRDGDVLTACQQVCPTQAIVFGDLLDPDSAVTRAKASPRNYGLLVELNTRPRTTYQVRLTNPNPQILEDEA